MQSEACLAYAPRALCNIPCQCFYSLRQLKMTEHHFSDWAPPVIGYKAVRYYLKWSHIWVNLQCIFTASCAQNDHKTRKLFFFMCTHLSNDSASETLSCCKLKPLFLHELRLLLRLHFIIIWLWDLVLHLSPFITVSAWPYTHRDIRHARRLV